MKEFDRKDLAEQIAADTGLDADTVMTVLRSVSKQVGQALAEAKRIEWFDLGVFTLEDMAPRSGVAPNGTRFETPARQRISFDASVQLAGRVATETDQETY